MVGDPIWLPHPVEAMGCLVNLLREKVESIDDLKQDLEQALK